jgi:hypothetical protein
VSPATTKCLMDYLVYCKNRECPVSYLCNISMCMPMGVLLLDPWNLYVFYCFYGLALWQDDCDDHLNGDDGYQNVYRFGYLNGYDGYDAYQNVYLFGYLNGYLNGFLKVSEWLSDSFLFGFINGYDEYRNGYGGFQKGYLIGYLIVFLIDSDGNDSYLTGYLKTWPSFLTSTSMFHSWITSYVQVFCYAFSGHLWALLEILWDLKSGLAVWVSLAAMLVRLVLNSGNNK